MEKDLIFRQESFDLLQDILEEAGELKERAPYKDLVTTTYAEKAAKQATIPRKPINSVLRYLQNRQLLLLTMV